jgi:hypothetical protein
MLNDVLLLQVVREVNAGWQRKKYEELLVELGLYSISTLKDNEEFSGLTKYNLILDTLRTHDQAVLLVEINKRHKFSEELTQALSEAGIDLRSIERGAEPTQVTEPVNTSHPETNPDAVVEQPKPIKDTIQGQTAGNKMKKKIEITQAQAVIIAAVITGLFLIILAFLTPWAEIIVKQPTRTPKPTSLAIEQLPFTIYPFDGDHDLNVGCCAGSAYFKYTINADHLSEYAFDYSLPADSQKIIYAGIAFKFAQSQILSEYQNIELTITFSDQANQIEMRFEDIANTQEPYRIVGKTNSTSIIIVPLRNFVKTDLKAVRAIDFQVDSTFALGNGKFVIKNIKFTK